MYPRKKFRICIMKILLPKVVNSKGKCVAEVTDENTASNERDPINVPEGLIIQNAILTFLIEDLFVM